jgi:hypothetical protein
MAKVPVCAAVDLERAVAAESSDLMTDLTPWRIAGTYFESCNCQAICPCRMIGDRPGGGRSTYGTCYGALSWLIEEGVAGSVDLAGRAAVLVFTYNDDEPGSPWSMLLHLDDRAGEDQRAALQSIFLGELGGGVGGLPWIRKARLLHGVRASMIEIEHAGTAHALRVGDAVTIRATRRVPTEERVACGIPGYHIAGTELYADELHTHDEPFTWELSGNCAFVSAFAYAS